MDTRKRRRLGLLFLLALVAALIPVVIASAQSGGGYDLAWNVVAGGGTLSAGGGYWLGGSIGQAGAGQLAGGEYGLTGGFWGGLPLYGGYLPLVRK